VRQKKGEKWKNMGEIRYKLVEGKNGRKKVDGTQTVATVKSGDGNYIKTTSSF